MAQSFVGEIRMFGGNFAPAGWMFCEGQLLPISENETLFNLIGTTYGGDGQTTFGLPDLRGRVPIHQGNAFVLGQKAGVEQVTLTVQQIPIHSHAAQGANAAATSVDPTNNVPATTSTNVTPYGSDVPSPLSPSSIGSVGGNQPHSNLQPFLCISFIISLFGVFPSQN